MIHSVITSKRGRSNLIKKCAFTLAEVLITLGIIGVVAAMTLPVLVNKYQEKVTVSKVKKFYSTMNQVLLMSIKDNGYPSEWSISDGQNSTTAKQLAQYLIPHMKIIKDCGVNSGCLKYTSKAKFLDGNISNINYDTDNRYYKIILADNSYIWFRSSTPYCINDAPAYYTIKNTCFSIFFDINGYKPPNTIGKDIFGSAIDKDGKIDLDIADCTKTSKGWGCGGYILINSNMNYLK